MHDSDEGFRTVLDDLPIAGFDRFRIDQIAAGGDGDRAGTDEIGGVLGIDSTGWDELDLGEGTAHVLQILRAEHGGGEDFDEARAGLPGGQDLGRGERSDRGRDAVTLAELDGGDAYGWCNDERRAGED